MKRSRIILLGIDGMDFDYTSRTLTKLPTIKNLAKSGNLSPFRSVFPPDSIPSWITCYTGKDPSEHGILKTLNYLSNVKDRLNVDISSFRGKTFWDRIGETGYKVCVINPFLAYPVWSVNGCMINGPVFINGQIQISDSSWTDGIKIPKSLGGIVDIPTKKTIKKFLHKTFSDTVEQAEFGLAVWQKNRPDFYFQTFLTMDRIQHFLWRYCDKKDPTYPGTNLYEDSIKEFYVYMDQIIGNFNKLLSPDDHLIVISDHGHGMRCTHCFNINEFLRKFGYVRSVAEGKIFSKHLIIEKLKNIVLNFMYENNLEDFISKIAKMVPRAQTLKKGKHITQDSHNIAYASDFAGTNPFGGVCINKDLAGGYDQTRTRLIKLLNNVKVNNGPIFKWIIEREKMFNGPFLERLPDILFCLRSKYGVDWNLHTKEITINPMHKKVSGGHKEYGVFISNIPKKRFYDSKDINMLNFFSTILGLYGLDDRFKTSGHSFIQKN